MPWSDIVGQDAVVARLRAALAAGRLHPALLFEGPEGVGKRLTALTLAQAIHCPSAPGRDGDPCGSCRVCLAIAASGDPSRTLENQSAHPGVRVVTPSRPDERELAFGAAAGRGEVRSQIAVAQIRVAIAEGAVRGFTTARAPRVVIVDPADRMGESAANALLKTLEEPPAGERFVLVTARASALLPTIRSRCVRVRFGLLPPDDLRRAACDRIGRSPRGPEGRAPAAGRRGGSSSDGAGGRSGGVPRGGSSHGGSEEDVDLAVSLAGGRLGRALELLRGGALEAYRARREAVLDGLDALVRGLPAGTFAVIEAAGTAAREREDWLEAIGVLELVLRDLAVLGADAGARLVNQDAAARLARLSPVLGERAARALPLLDAVRGEFRVNVNARLAMERILLEIARP